jgi:hypothetical protein
MKRIPKKGSIGWFDLAGINKPNKDGARDETLDGIEVGIRYVGMSLATHWTSEWQALRQSEIERLAKLRSGKTKETAPELWDGFVTPDCMKAVEALTESILKQALASVRGIEGDVASLIDALSAEQRSGVAHAAIAQQKLGNESFFCSES